MRFLGIETSCDETAAAVVEGSILPDGSAHGEIQSNVILGQKDHTAFGGVVPEIAARAHVEALDQVIIAALRKADCDFCDLSGVAVTAGPGLVGGLIVGLMSAKAICWVHKLPMIALNHLEGHALTVRLSHGLSYPYILLLVSGGHSQILLIKGLGDYLRLGTTIDDALGEAFDKTAKLLGLGYPGGPEVEKYARDGDPNRFDFPKPLHGKMPPNFSFSGLKTALRLQAEALARSAPLSYQDVCDLCASFQEAVAKTVEDRLIHAWQWVVREDYGQQSLVPIVVAGGVAANKVLRLRLEQVAKSLGTTMFAPPVELCGDNAAMIAWAGLERYSTTGKADDFSMAPRSRWPLDEAAAPVLGSGKAGVKV